jgi:hypothetical protein
MTAEKVYRISGHESFPCRYTWLPKAVRGLRENAKLFSDDSDAMVHLGVGKNMVRSIRFWSQAADMVTVATKGGGHKLTDLGRDILGDGGLDPFLEDIRTLWLIHWNLSTDVAHPLLAWDYLLNRWQEPELVPSRALRALQQEAAKDDDGLSVVTLEQHLDTFLHTYVPTRGKKGEVQEDNLDCPLVELEFIEKVGARELDQLAGGRESIYNFRREEKPDISPELFVYCLSDFWEKRHPEALTVTFQEIAHGHGSPGQIFKLPEEDVRSRVQLWTGRVKGVFTYEESANIQQIRRNGQHDSHKLLQEIYSTETTHE